MLDRQKLQIGNAKLIEKLSEERERGKQLSAGIRSHINEIMDMNVDSNIKAAGKLFLDAKNEEEENVAVNNFLKLINVYTKSNPPLPFFSKPKSEQVTNHNAPPRKQENCHKKRRLGN